MVDLQPNWARFEMEPLQGTYTTPLNCHFASRKRRQQQQVCYNVTGEYASLQFAPMKLLQIQLRNISLSSA